MTRSYPVRLRAVFLALVTFVIASTTLMAQWSALPALPQNLLNTQQAVVNNKLYVFGGMLVSGATQADAYTLDLANTAAGWQQIAAMPETRALGYAAAHNGKIYIVGGVGTDNGVSGRATVLEYNPSTDSYTPKAAAPAAAWYGGGAIAGSKIYYIGGLARIANQNTGIQATQIYDITTDSWTTGPNLPFVSYYGAAGAVGNDVYYFGGRVQNSQGTFYSGSTFKLAGGAGSWATVPGTMHKSVEHTAAGSLDGKIYAAGGSNQGTQINVTQVFDPAAGTWSAYYPMLNTTQSGGALAMAADALYHAGGTAFVPQKLTTGDPVAIASVQPSNVVIAVKAGGSSMRSFDVKNTGVVDLTGTIEVAGDAPWLTASTSSINVRPGAAQNVELTANAASLPLGVHNTTVTVRSNDGENPALQVPVRVYVVESLVEQPMTAVLEEATGSWCGPCGAYGTPEVRRLRAQFGERLITLAYHDRGGAYQDPMANSQTEGINNKLGVRAFPTGAVNRIVWPGSTAPATSLSNWEPAIETVLNSMPIAPIALEVVEYAFDASTKRVTAKIKITSADAIDLTGKTLRLTAVVMEDSLQYSQYQGTENPYYHMHVARSFWPNIDGEQIALPSGAVDANSVLIPGKEATINASFAATSVTRPAKGHVVWILSVNQGATLGMILQAHEMGLTDRVTAGGGGNATVTVTPDAAVKNIAVGQTAVFNTVVSNVSDAAIEVSVDRTANTMPSSEWSSQLCVNDNCEPATTNRVTTTLTPGQTVTFKVKVVGGTESAQGSVGIRIASGDTSVLQIYTVNTGTSSVEAETGNETMFSLSAYPNPAIGTTRVEFTVPTTGNVALDLFSTTGAKVKSLLNARHEAGRHSVSADLSALPAGVYSLVMSSGGRSSARTITIVR